MKIREVATGPAGPVAGKSSDEKTNRNRVEQNSFKDSLNRARHAGIEERVNALMQEIEEQGRRLADSLNLKDLLLFKKRVREFMQEAVNGMLKFSKGSVLDRRGRHRIYALVKRINRELEELTGQMMEQQKDRLKILQKVDNIRGLLIDLYI